MEGPTEFYIPTGQSLDVTAVLMVDLANKGNTTIHSEFNEIPISASPGDDPVQIANTCRLALKKRRSEHYASLVNPVAELLKEAADSFKSESVDYGKIARRLVWYCQCNEINPNDLKDIIRLLT